MWNPEDSHMKAKATEEVGAAWSWAAKHFGGALLGDRRRANGLSGWRR